MAVGDRQTIGQLFVVGMNGSGTTMLRDHLANHSWIYGFPSETRSLPYFIQHESDYGDLNLDENFLRLWNDIKASLAKESGPLFMDIPTPPRAKWSASGAFDHIMHHLAVLNGRRIWCEKTPMYVHHIALLASAFPAAKFIHVIRDGRDCAASFHRRWGFNPVRTIARWKSAVRAGQRDGGTLDSRYVEVRYEQITESPDEVLRDLLAFLAVPAETSIQDSQRSRNGASPDAPGKIIRNDRKADDYFVPAAMQKMEAVGGRLLAELGYTCSNPLGDCDPQAWQMRYWRVMDDMRRFLTVSFTRGRILRPSKWRYIAGRTRNALKQRATTKS